MIERCCCVVISRKSKGQLPIFVGNHSNYARFVVNLGPQSYSVQFFVLPAVFGDVRFSLLRFCTIERCCCVGISFKKSKRQLPVSLGNQAIYVGRCVTNKYASAATVYVEMKCVRQ